MKKISAILLIAGWLVSIYATDARVLTMGGNDNFFMDDMSIYRNPANINYYPNMLIGSLGLFLPDSAMDTGQLAALRLQTRDPQRPFGGTILSYSLNQSSESGSQYPLLSVGAIFNRWDPLLNYIDPNTIEFRKAFGTNKRDLVSPVGKIDLMLGYALKNGAMIGIGTYLAFQKENKLSTLYESNLYKGNIGVNWPIAKTMNLEASFGVATITAKGKVYRQISPSITDTVNESIADRNFSFKGDLRLFSSLTNLNGDFVPHFSIERLGFNGYDAMNYSLGVGVNVNIDKGFFWTGIEGLVENKNYSKINSISRDSLSTGIGGRLSAGIERNVVWDWLVLRIGVSKKLMYVSEAGENGHWEQNPESNSSDEDFAAVGVGVNIDNRFKIDGVVAENIFYTWTNLISSPQHHLMNRITLTYSF
jgi:hypothetical protein